MAPSFPRVRVGWAGAPLVGSLRFFGLGVVASVGCSVVFSSSSLVRGMRVEVGLKPEEATNCQRRVPKGEV